MSATTKKFPVSISFESFEAKSNEFIVPIAGGNNTNEFVGIKSGGRFPYGAVSYIGKAVSVIDVLEKMTQAGIEVSDATAAVEVLDKYLQRLQEFKIGSILGIEYSPAGDFTLVKVAVRPPRKRKKGDSHQI